MTDEILNKKLCLIFDLSLPNEKKNSKQSLFISVGHEVPGNLLWNAIRTLFTMLIKNILRPFNRNTESDEQLQHHPATSHF